MLLNSFRRWSNRTLAVSVAAGVIAAVALPAPIFAQQASPPPASGQTAPAKAAVPAKAAAKPAAKKKAEPAPGTLDGAQAQAEVEAGVNELAQGRGEAAVTHLTAAISSKGLPAAQSARAMYYRGVAYRRQAKPAQAISDLTSALWIKAGLTEEQRADALQQRSAAYREAGLPDQSAPQGSTAAAKSGRMAGSASTPFASVAPAPPAAPSSGGGFFSSLFGGTSAPAAPAPSTPSTPAAQPAVPVAASPVRTVAPSTTSSVTSVAAMAPSEPVAGKPATRMVPLTPVASDLPMGFQDLPGDTREVEVSTSARAAPASTVAAKPWDTATQVKPAPGTKKIAAAPVAANLAPAPSTAVPSRVAGGPVPPLAGKVRVQVAAVRSAQEALGVVARVQTGFQRELGGRLPVVAQSTVGNLGTLYKVQVGPFASAQDTRALCTRLRSEGLDCRIETP